MTYNESYSIYKLIYDMCHDIDNTDRETLNNNIFDIISKNTNFIDITKNLMTV